MMTRCALATVMPPVRSVGLSSLGCVVSRGRTRQPAPSSAPPSSSLRRRRHAPGWARVSTAVADKWRCRHSPSVTPRLALGFSTRSRRDSLSAIGSGSAYRSSSSTQGPHSCTAGSCQTAPCQTLGRCSDWPASSAAQRWRSCWTSSSPAASTRRCSGTAGRSTVAFDRARAAGVIRTVRSGAERPVSGRPSSEEARCGHRPWGTWWRSRSIQPAQPGVRSRAPGMRVLL